MQISLKRALKLRKELEGRLSSMEFPTAVNISLLTDLSREQIETAIEAASTAIDKAFAQYEQLSRVLAELRQNIAKANLDNGVEAALSEIAHIDRKITIRKKLASIAVMPQIDAVMAEVEFARRALISPDTTSYRSPSKAIGFSAVSEALKHEIAGELAQLRRDREAIEDKRAAANAGTRITIADEDNELLRQLGIL